MTMKILYDHQIFSFQRFGGISRYFTELMEGIAQSGEATPILPFPFNANEYLSHSSFSRPWLTYRGNCRHLRQLACLANRKASSRALAKGGFDIFHPTYYEDYFLDRHAHGPMVLTVVDMTPEMLPEYFEANPHRDKKKLALAASAIIAISHNTKKDIVSVYGIDPGRIQVIHLASSILPGGAWQVPKNLSLPSQYLLFVGARERYKNFALFSKAAAKIMNRRPELSLVCVGGGPFRTDDLEAFQKTALQHRVHWLDVGEHDLPAIFAHARVFVFPSLYEGFGIPIIESFNCRCKVALSNRSCFPEIALDAALYFDPLNVESMCESIEKLLDDKLLGAKQVEQGLRRARDFSWRQMTRQTMEVYRSLL